MKKLILILLLGGFALTSCQKDDLSAASDLEAVEGRAKAKGKKGENRLQFDPCEESTASATLLAGQFTEVGTVSVQVNEFGNLEVTYETLPGVCMTETHLSVTTSPGDFPINGGGNPKIGNFEEGDEFGDCRNTASYEVENPGGTVYIAAHAVVQGNFSSPDDLENGLPNTIDFETIDQGPDTYLNIDILSKGFVNGPSGAWCVDDDASILLGQTYTNASVYLSTGELPEGHFEYPENFDLVNYLLNQNLVGTNSPGGFGVYTYGDVQFAIWYLIDDVARPDGSDYSLGAFNENRVMELVALAEANGEGYMPGCGDIVGIIIKPQNNVQPLIIPYTLFCGEETAWADGCDFPGNNWATYFRYDIP